MTRLDQGNPESDSNILPSSKEADNRHIREEAKYNLSTSQQSCKMTALYFGPECTDLRHIDLNVINNQKHTYPRVKENLACYPQSMDETLAK